MDRLSFFDRLRATKRFMRATFFEMLKPFETRAAMSSGPVVLVLTLASDSDTTLISGVTVVLLKELNAILFLKCLFEFMSRLYELRTSKAVPFLLANRRFLAPNLKMDFWPFGAPWRCCAKTAHMPISP